MSFGRPDDVLVLRHVAELTVIEWAPSRDARPDRFTGSGRSHQEDDVGDGSPRVHVGYAVVELHLPGVQGLKEKRGFVKSITAALVDDLGASVAEVGWQDLWQRSALGVAVVASSPTGVDRALERVVTMCERDPRVLVTAMVEQVDVLHGTT